MMFDYLIVGAGLFGAVFAQQMKAAGKAPLIIDRRNHIGGNIFTEDCEGIDIHKYGAHIFHTDNSDVWEYVRRFSEFNSFIHRPLANFRGTLFALPFNMNTFQQMWGVKNAEEAKSIISRQRAELKGPARNLEEQAISLVGRDIYEKLIKGYTEKQWGRACRELPSFIISRIPVRFSFDNSYFDAKYQGIPVGGYTKMVQRMLDGVEIRLGIDYLSNRSSLDPLATKVVYTGAIDEYFDYCFGALQYRSVRFETELFDIPDFQGNAVINYTDIDTPYTRVIEHKWFQFGKDARGQDIPLTIISREYSREWAVGDEPYYPINNDKNNSLYLKYRKLADNSKKVVFGGRLGEYKYYDMDQVVESAIRLAKQELAGGGSTI